MLKEFKSFAIKGNVIDLAAGVIIGGAFGKIVSSLVNDIIMPFVGLVTGGQKFSNLFIVLREPPEGFEVDTIADAAALNIPTINYGVFLTQIIDFVIIAFTVFIMVKVITKIKTTALDMAKKPEESVTEKVLSIKSCPWCKSEIHIDAVKCPNCTSKL